MRKGADDYEAKWVCEAEQKRKEHKARAKGPSSESDIILLWTAPFATDSLELKLVWSAIKECINAPELEVDE